MSLSNEYLAAGNCYGWGASIKFGPVHMVYFRAANLRFCTNYSIKLKELQNSDSKYVTMTQDILGGPFSLPQKSKIFQSTCSAKESLGSYVLIDMWFFITFLLSPSQKILNFKVRARL